MGCCLSRDGGRSVVKQQPLVAEKSSSSSPEKEVVTVKEVLSLTPTHPTTKPDAETDIPEPDHTSCVKAPELGRVVACEMSPIRPSAAKIEEVVDEAKNFKLAAGDAVSDASECYSYNESRSTTTVTEIRDDNDEGEVNSSQLRQWMKPNRSPARCSNRGSTQQQRVVSQSNRPQPTRNAAVSNPKPRRESNQSPARRPEPRRAVGESPVRRTASPAATRMCGPRPIRPVPLSPNRAGHGRMEESLENPLVSLECFIFL